MDKQNNTPKHWQVKKLEEVCEIIMGQSPPSSTYNTKGIGLPFFQGKAEFTELYPIAEKWCSSPNKIAESNDILLSVRAPVGTTNVANQKCCIGRGLAAIRYENYKYILYFLKNIEQQLDKKGTGTTFRAISGETIRTTRIPLPPLPEQQAIVAKIEELLSDLENGKQQLQTAQQQLKVYRQSLLKVAFEGISSPKIISVEECCTHIVDCLHSTAKFTSQGKYCIDTTCIDNGKILYERIRYVDEETYKERISRLKPEEGDILFAREGTVGTTVIVPKNIDLCLGQRMMMFRLKQDLLPKYLMYYFKSSIFKTQYQPLIMGTTAPHLNIRDIRKFSVLTCSLKEQQLIVDELESKLTVCDKIEETISQSLLQAETLRQSILKRAFEGKLVAPQNEVSIYKPRNEYFYQMQVLALIAKRSKQEHVQHGEMTLAKYAYLLDKVYNIPTYYEYNRWHLGPYPPQIKKAINNKKFFKKTENHIEVINEETLFGYSNHFHKEIIDAICDLTNIFSKYPVKERSHKTELLATVCKVVEDIQCVDLQAVRKSMMEWKIELDNKHFNNKAEKFSEYETVKCLQFINEKGWDKKLLR